jgi:uncharacterized membrane protein (GlpM family)
MSSQLALKLLLVPTFIGLVSLAGKRWGPTIAGWLAGLPVVAGPILYLLWLEQGAKFARDAAVYSLAAVAPGMVFAVVYAWASRRWRWPLTAAFAYGAWSLAAVTLLLLRIGILSATLLAVGALIIAPRAFPHQTSTPVTTRPPKFDLELRVLAGVALTLLVTSIANIGGTRVSGILSLFPVISGVLAVFIHRGGGSDAAIAALRGLARGFWSLAAFCATLAIEPAASTGIAFGAATAVAIGIQALLPRR